MSFTCAADEAAPEVGSPNGDDHVNSDDHTNSGAEEAQKRRAQVNDLQQHLNIVVSELKELTVLKHQLDARETTLLAQAESIAAEIAKRTSGAQSYELAQRSMHAEIGTALRVSDRTVGNRVAYATKLEEKYPSTLRTLTSGAISYRHTTVICDEGNLISDADNRAAYEEAVLDYAKHESVNRLRPIAKRLAAQFSDLSIDQRHAAAARLRRVTLIDGDDGMSDLIATLPSVEAHAIKDRLNQMAWAVRRGETAAAGSTPTDGATGGAGGATEATSVPTTGETSVPASAPTVQAETITADPRTLDEIRADIFSDLALAGMPSPELAGKGLGSIRALVQVTVSKKSLSTAIRRRDTRDKQPQAPPPSDSQPPSSSPPPPSSPPLPTPAHLTGYGAIDSITAHELAGLADTWDEAAFHPNTGDIISVDRYRPSEEMKRLLRVRDQHCCFPGCRVPARRCDIDHTIDAALGGSTSTDNMAHLCRRHHTLKHHSNWKLKQLPSGILKWTTPGNRVYYNSPASRVMFRNPRGSSAGDEEHPF